MDAVGFVVLLGSRVETKPPGLVFPRLDGGVVGQFDLDFGFCWNG